MLSNNADAFFTTPMRHTVVKGGNMGNQTPMPAPRGLSESATGVVTTRMTGDFLPGLGDPDSLFNTISSTAQGVQAALAPAAPVAVAQPTTASKILGAIMTPVGLSVAIGFLFLTPPGKALRRKVFG